MEHKTKCDCPRCKLKEGLKNFGSAVAFYNACTIEEKQEWNRHFIAGIIRHREDAQAAAFIEASNLNLLSIEKFNKTIGLLNEDEINELSDLLYEPFIHKKIKDSPVEHWGDGVFRQDNNVEWETIKDRAQSYLESLPDQKRKKIVKLSDALINAVASKDFSEVRSIIANETDEKTLQEMRVLSSIALAIAKEQI